VASQLESIFLFNFSVFIDVVQLISLKFFHGPFDFILFLQTAGFKFNRDLFGGIFFRELL
jgi:hypothetical protein